MQNSVRMLPIPVTILYLLLWARYPLFEFLVGFCYHVPLLENFSAQMPDILIVAFIILSLPYLSKHLRMSDLLFYLIIACYYLISMNTTKDNSVALEYYSTPFLLICLPYFFVGVLIEIKPLWRYMYYISFASVMLKGVYTFFLGGNEVLGEESMTAAYSLLPHLLLVIWYAISTRHLWDCLAVVLGILLLFAFGNRGTLIISMIFAVFCFFQTMAKTTKRSTYYVLAFFVAAAVALLYSGISDSILSFLNSTGSSTRVFDKTETDGFFSSEGRLDIFALVLPAIASNPLGLGIAGDRILGVIYSHNLIMELLISYGWLFGTAIIVAITVLFVKAFKRVPTVEHKVFLMLLLCSGVFKLMLSNTYLNDTFIFFMIGFCVSILRMPKQRIGSL